MRETTKRINRESVSEWMTRDVICVNSRAIVKEAFDILDNHTIFGIPVIDDDGLYLGLMSKTVIMNYISNPSVFKLPITDIMLTDSETIHFDQTIDEAARLRGGCLPVLDDVGKLVGIITRTDIIKANTSALEKVDEKVDTAETLRLILNSAYEGIVVVNSEGYIQEINDAYCRIINRKKEEVIGRQVESVIENTRLREVAQTGVEERGRIQQISGMNLVVHRIPLFKNNQPSGAIGVLIFKDISEMQEINARMNIKKNLNLQDDVRQEDILKRIIGDSDSMKRVKKLAKKAANCSSNVFISGSSGTGKEVFAKAIHDMSSFSSGKFVTVNCSAIPESLLESELFGYEEGAFTDALKGGKLGKFEMAEGGTVFLDEIGDMPFHLQAKLLRVIQERTIEKVGSIEAKKVNVRIITATHQNLNKMVQEGTFREDLYYRINVIQLRLPDLSERREDIPLFITQSMTKFCNQFHFEPKSVNPVAMRQLVAYDWQGNIRHLLNICEALVALTDGRIITEQDLPKEIRDYYYDIQLEKMGLDLTLVEEKEREVIMDLLAHYDGNKSAVARKLEINRNTLYEKLKKYELV
ncbi:MAG: sigma 54-interacting transcriptional regulator [Vagococcus sp.]